VRQVALSANSKLLLSGSSDTTALLWDVAAVTHRNPDKVVPVSAKEMEALWQALADADAVKAYQAIAALVLAPGQALPLLKQRLQPTAVVEPKRLTQLVANLESDRFRVRQKAAQELEILAEQAEGTLRQKLQEKVPLEVRQRIEQLLAKLEPPSGERLRGLRALEVLEHIGTKEARQVLTNLSKGPAETRLTKEAEAALRRLAGHP
jgi:hypothetical protein